MNSTLVSVIMPTYNSEKFVAEAIESILNQTYKELEIVITDDCSTDNTINILKKYAQQDSRVRYFCLEKNSGAGVARNNSIKEAQGRYLAFCDSDDAWIPTKIEKQLALMKEKNCLFAFSSYYRFNQNSKIVGIVIAPERVTLRSTKHDDKIGFSTAIYDTAKHGKLYMPSLRKRQDWAFVLEILKFTKEAYALKEPLVYYRYGNASISKNKISLLKYNAAVYTEVFGYSKLRAWAYLFFLFLPTHFMKLARTKIQNMKFRHNKE